MRTKNILIPKLIQPVFSGRGISGRTFGTNDEPNARKKGILRFLKHTVLPAMRELRQELIGKYDLGVQVNFV